MAEDIGQRYPLRKQKHKVDTLVKNHTDLLEIVADTNERHNEVLSKVHDKDDQIAFLHKVPFVGLSDNFRPT